MKCPVCGAEIDASNRYRCSRFPICTYISPESETTEKLEEHLDRYILFDLETTGFSRQKDRIIEIGAIKVSKGRIVGRFSEFANPGKLVTSRITDLTGITNKMLAPAAPESDVVRQFIEWGQGYDVLIGHNINAFDIPFLKQACRRADVQFPFGYSMDTLVLARDYLTELPNHKQPTLAKHYGIRYEAHRAINDAEALKKILKAMLKEIEAKGGKPKVKKI